MSGGPILVVDDNRATAQAVTAVLEHAGYQVRSARDADETLALLREFRPRLILMDIQLPGIDGLTLTRMLKANPSLRDIPVVGLTGFAMEGEASRLREAGCDGYIAKPLDTRPFLDTIASYLTGTRRGAER